MYSFLTKIFKNTDIETIMHSEINGNLTKKIER